MIWSPSALARCRSGAGAAEFALLLPLLLIFLFGIIDVGRAMWTWNRAEKATQMGARYAITTDMIPAGLMDYSFAIDGNIGQGEPIPESSFGGATCTMDGCACMDGATCPDLGTASTDAFDNILARMQQFYPQIDDDNLEIDYAFSGLGYAGDPNGPDVAPLVTVRLKDLEFQPLLLMAFQTAIELPPFKTALTLEDGQGTVAN